MERRGLLRKDWKCVPKCGKGERKTPSKNLAPQGKVENLHQKLEQFAKKNSLLLNPKFDWKISWMETHQGRCFCDWENRFCPCEHALEDLKRFGGICLCGVLCTKDKLLYYQTAHETKLLSPEEKKAAKERLKQQQKKNENVYQHIFKKRKRKG